MNVVLLGFRRSKYRHFVHQPAHIHFSEAKLHRAGKVNKSLHHAVKTPDLIANHIHVAARIRIYLMQLLPQYLQMDHDGIDGIFYLVGNA